MSEEKAKLSGPDLTQGIELSTIPDGTMLLGHALGEPVLLARCDDEVFAIGAMCTHYGAPLEQGLLDGDTVRCQWHHACFSLRTGEALRAPALNPVSHWRVEHWHREEARDVARQFTPVETPVGSVYVQEKLGGTVYVREKLDSVNRPSQALMAGIPTTVVIVGGGAAGNAAAEMLRREGYSGRITMLSADESTPCDRPNLSKGFLSGAASDESNLLRSREFYKDHEIDLHLSARVTTIDPVSRQVQLADGTRHAFDALLLATGAEPVDRRVFHHDPWSYRRSLRGGTRIYRLALLQRRRTAAQESCSNPHGDQSHRRRAVRDKYLAARQRSPKFGYEPECSRGPFDYRRSTPLRVRLARRSDGACLRCRRLGSRIML
jgi:nitrite reductase/ring-hydroxylating ferredoxin subunit